jgi:hypothetical protein
MQAVCSSETSVSVYKSTCCYPEDQHQHLHLRENLKSKTNIYINNYFVHICVFTHLGLSLFGSKDRSNLSIITGFMGSLKTSDSFKSGHVSWRNRATGWRDMIFTIEWVAFLFLIQNIRIDSQPEVREFWFSSDPPASCRDTSLKYSATACFNTVPSSLLTSMVTLTART